MVSPRITARLVAFQTLGMGAVGKTFGAGGVGPLPVTVARRSEVIRLAG